MSNVILILVEPQFWYDHGQESMQTILKAKQEGVAKNVIMFLGDGMGVSTATGGRIWAGQQLGMNGEEHELSWDKFPFTGLSKTYNVDRQTTDSAASGTAFHCGIKTRQGVLGLSGRAMRGNCSTVEGNEVESILNWAMAAGKSSGLVSTARITHATPAAAYAKCPERNWESDRKIPDSEKNCSDVSYQLVMQNARIQVLMGGGRAFFLPEGVADPDPDPSYDMNKASRTDGLNLVEEWKKEKASRGFTHSYVYDKTGFDNVNPQDTDYLLGLFNQGHMQYEVERNKTKEPSIAEMTAKAIRILSKNDNGFFLMVEGGRIDHANHESWAYKAFAEVEAMNQAVHAAKNLTSEQDTLIVVTADHSHVLAIAGYAGRGNLITGLSGMREGEPDVTRATDGLPYTTVVYGNGPGWTSGPRVNLTEVDTHAPDYRVDSVVPMSSETHAGEDVAIYASGPQSFLYTGTHEQNYIPLVMAYASCVGPYAEGKLPCAKKTAEQCVTVINQPDAAAIPRSLPWIIATLTVLSMLPVLW
ncbi:hypothetical protein RRG08_007530 [Elysia crispata]|uniref:alkaline phosphatase n=1 Tax=Elysia crispata TaxID=231223 RepID=A0AAE0YGK4_9GAST|nr:hypothetical protein RRG08_007530 [Elysia crispata]